MILYAVERGKKTMASMEINPALYVADRAGWREWLSEQHAIAQSIWLISYKAGTGKPSIAYLHAVEEALCFGWIDGIAKRMDAERTRGAPGATGQS